MAVFRLVEEEAAVLDVVLDADIVCIGLVTSISHFRYRLSVPNNELTGLRREKSVK